MSTFIGQKCCGYIYLIMMAIQLGFQPFWRNFSQSETTHAPPSTSHAAHARAKSIGIEVLRGSLARQQHIPHPPISSLHLPAHHPHLYIPYVRRHKPFGAVPTTDFTTATQGHKITIDGPISHPTSLSVGSSLATSQALQAVFWHGSWPMAAYGDKKEIILHFDIQRSELPTHTFKPGRWRIRLLL